MSTAERAALCVATGILLALSLETPDLSAQTLSGRILDAANDGPVGLAAVIVLDAQRTPLITSAADAEGRYRIELPAPGVYYLFVERLGYFENETPLFSVRSTGSYGIDVELRPEPIRLDPLEVTVSNETLEDFLTLDLGQHPASVPGYRSIQGLRLEQAKRMAEDNTDLLRKLYIPVSHGSSVCVGTFGSGAELPARMGYERVMEATEDRERDPRTRQCGALYLNGHRCRNELIEEIHMDRIAVVVAFRDAVHLYTRDFDWTYRPGFSGAVC
ncbi:MAG: carboxypeptidase-like regulatory domain-containing protein [Longimicrobiales bacterium]|nr:carboxypeptidase-like regulatory domain-containing protein [Longimicrobiales bacterium]